MNFFSKWGGKPPVTAWIHLSRPSRPRAVTTRSASCQFWSSLILSKFEVKLSFSRDDCRKANRFSLTFRVKSATHNLPRRHRIFSYDKGESRKINWAFDLFSDEEITVISVCTRDTVICSYNYLIIP